MKLARRLDGWSVVMPMTLNPCGAVAPLPRAQARGDLAARAAPGRPEVDEDDPAAKGRHRCGEPTGRGEPFPCWARDSRRGPMRKIASLRREVAQKRRSRAGSSAADDRDSDDVADAVEPERTDDLVRALDDEPNHPGAPVIGTQPSLLGRRAVHDVLDADARAFAGRGHRDAEPAAGRARPGVRRSAENRELAVLDRDERSRGSRRSQMSTQASSGAPTGSVATRPPATAQAEGSQNTAARRSARCRARVWCFSRDSTEGPRSATGSYA